MSVSNFHIFDKELILKLDHDFIRIKSRKDLLLLSIEKWETIVKYLQLHPWVKTMDDRGIQTCACCIAYFRDDCTDCPIYFYTGMLFCGETPYVEYHDKSRRGLRTLMDAKREVKLLKEILRYIEKHGE